MSRLVRVAVVGGGLGGLLVASELRRRGAEVVVLEATGEPGGVAASLRDGQWLLDPAASSLILPHPHLSPILDWAGVETVPAPAGARRRFVYERGRLVELKESPALLFAGLVSWRGVLRAFAEPFVRPSPDDGEESLQSFLTRRFGSDAGLLVATLAAHGVYAADPSKLSVRAAFPAVANLEDQAGSIVRGALRRLRQRPKGKPRPSTHVMRSGMSELAEKLAAKVDLRCGWPVTSVEPTGRRWVVRAEGGDEEVDQVVVALAPGAAARLVPEQVAAKLRGFRASPVAIVALGARGAQLPIPPGFGVLAGPRSGLRVLGVLFESEIAPGRAPAGHRMAKSIFGGSADPAVMELSDAELVELAASELGVMLDLGVQPSWTKVVRHYPGIPQYEIGHLALLDDLEHALMELPGLHLGGWAYRGVGLTGLATDAARIAERIGS